MSLVLRKRLLILTIVGIFCFLSYSLVNRFIIFNVIGVSPSSVKTSTKEIIVKFNKELRPITKSQVNISPNGEYVVKTEGKNIIILFAAAPDEGEFSIGLKDITSESGKTLSKNLTFTASYVPGNKLSKEEQQQDLQRSDSFERYPITEKLPLLTSSFEIDFRFPNKQQTKLPIVVTSLLQTPKPAELISDNPDFNNPDVQKYLSELRSSRQQALIALQTIGFNQSEHELYFTEPYLTTEFSGKYLGELESGH